MFCNAIFNWTASSEFGTYRLCEQRRFRRACASAQSRQNLRCSLIQAVSQEEPSDRKRDLWPLWMAGHAQLKFVMTECSKTQIRLTRLNFTMPKRRSAGCGQCVTWGGSVRGGGGGELSQPVVLCVLSQPVVLCVLSQVVCVLCAFVHCLPKHAHTTFFKLLGFKLLGFSKTDEVKQKGAIIALYLVWLLSICKFCY